MLHFLSKMPSTAFQKRTGEPIFESNWRYRPHFPIPYKLRTAFGHRPARPGIQPAPTRVGRTPTPRPRPWCGQPATGTACRGHGGRSCPGGPLRRSRRRQTTFCRPRSMPGSAWKRPLRHDRKGLGRPSGQACGFRDPGPDRYLSSITTAATGAHASHHLIAGRNPNASLIHYLKNTYIPHLRNLCVASPGYGVSLRRILPHACRRLRPPIQ